jgi:hypothetical protein
MQTAHPSRHLAPGREREKDNDEKEKDNFQYRKTEKM